MYSIIVNQGNKKKTITAKANENLYKLLFKDFHINSPCAGAGVCGKCRVTIKSAQDITYDSKLLKESDAEKGIRLACCVNVNRDMEVFIQEEKEAKILVKTIQDNVEVFPEVEIKLLKIDESSLNNQMGIYERIKKEGYNISPSMLSKIQPYLDKKSEVRIGVRGKEIVSVLSEGKAYLVGIDVGTTTIAGYLVDYEKGEIVDIYSELNLQKRFGHDVISRIEYTVTTENGLDEMADEIRKQINNIIDYFVSKVKSENILHIAIAGNTTMQHFLAKQNAKNISLAPFIPTFTSRLDFVSKDLELKGDYLVTLLPSSSAYVGADITSGLVSCEMDKSKDVCLFVDLGTNGEMALGNEEFLVCCSTAAGPAFEGGNISCGMGGRNGAVNKVFSENGKVKYTTLGEINAEGICGSGLIDLVAYLLKNGVIDESGAFTEEKFENYDKINLEYKLTEKVVLTQRDIRELQLAKGAVKAGILTMMQDAKINMQDIKKVYLAGGFGSFIDIENACVVGILPSELRDRIVSVGNTSGLGSVLSVKNLNYMKRIENVAEKMRYIELSAKPSFNIYFMETMIF